MENRLQTISKAAAALFIRQGYMRTQIKDIAAEIGLSTGMLYVYFKGKREILDFILKCTAQPSFMKQDFQYPIGAPLFEGLEEELIAVLRQNHAQFGAPLAQRANGYPFEQMLSDAFDTIARYGTGCLLLEKNIRDVGKLGEYYKTYRREFFEQVSQYAALYMARGEMRCVPCPALAVRQMIETLAWWGMHIQNDAFERQKDLPLPLAKETCLDCLVHAYKN